jgi:hypothetical protein
MIPAPTRIRDPLQLADWLEIQAILADDHNSSRGDLQALLQQESISPDDQEPLILAAYAELELRVSAARHAYPFRLRDSLLHLRHKSWRPYAAYVFCLLVSYGGVRRYGNLYPARLFETLSVRAAARFVGGRADQFGFPRAKLPRGFAEAVNALSVRICEGDGVFQNQVRDEKDDALDIVAWRAFPDRLPGQILLMGQCAAGNDWEKKRSELNPTAFWNKWAIRQPVSPLTKAFFTPHRLEISRWNNFGYDAGIIFDRCRIAYFAHSRRPARELLRWSDEILKSRFR